MSDFSIQLDTARETQYSNPKAGNFAEKSFVYAILTGIRLNLFKLLNVKVELSFSDYIKQQWKLNKTLEYPRSYLALTSFEVQRDRRNNLAMKASGLSNGNRSANNETGNYIKRAKTYPVKMSFEFHYFDSDMDRSIFFVENLAALIASNSFSFTLIIQEKFEHQIRIFFDDAISIPLLQYSNDTDPNSIEITTNLYVDTFVGIIEDGARVFDLGANETYQGATVQISE